MGLFTKSSPSGTDGGKRETAEQGRTEAPETVADIASNVQAISPLALRMQEQLRKLDALKTRIGGLNRSFDQMAALATESATSIAMLSEFMESARTQVETEVRLKSENAKLQTDLIDRTHELGSLRSQLDDAQAELHSLRKRGTETRTALEAARSELVSIRDNNKKVNEEYRSQSARLVEANARVAELDGELQDALARISSLEEQADNLTAALDAVTKRESELQQNLSESAALLEQANRRNNRLAGEMESTKRELADFRNDNIDLKSRLDVAAQEIDYAKSRLEEEQRKHDNEVFALKAEIENLSSQRRIGAQSLQEMSRENSSLKERHRELVKRMQEIEHLLQGAQKSHENDREELLQANAKLRELNLRYNAVLTDLNHERNQNRKYVTTIEELVEENKKLQKFRIKYDTANDQIRQLKSVISNYQMAMKEDGLTFEDLTLPEPASRGEAKPGGDIEGLDDDDDGVIVRLRD